MTNLKTRDVFKAFRLVKASHLRDELIPLLEELSKAENVDLKRAGMNVYLTIFEALAEQGAESGIYDLLSGPFEMTVDEIADMDADKLIEKLEELGKVSNLSAFFNALSKLTISM